MIEFISGIVLGVVVTVLVAKCLHKQVKNYEANNRYLQIQLNTRATQIQVLKNQLESLRSKPSVKG